MNAWVLTSDINLHCSLIGTYEAQFGRLLSSYHTPSKALCVGVLKMLSNSIRKGKKDVSKNLSLHRSLMSMSLSSTQAGLQNFMSLKRLTFTF
jgi:hypothetical protein